MSEAGNRAGSSEKDERRRRRLWMAAYVFTTFLSFPHPLPALGTDVVLDLGIGISFAAPVCLILGLRGLSVRRAAGSAFIWTVLAHGLILHFIFVVTVTYGHAPAVVGVIAPFGLAVYAASLGALFGGVWVWLRERGDGAGALTVAVLWTALDHLRSVFLTGWPWATLGYAQHGNPALLGLAQWTGVYGLSFAIVLGGVAVFEAGSAWRAGRRPGTGTLVALGLFAALHVFGFVTRTQPGVNDDMAPGTIRVAALQGNIDQGVKWNRDWIERTLSAYEELSRQAAAEGSQIIVWPETAVPGTIEADRVLQDRLRRLARETGASLVVGGVGIEFDRASGRVGSFFDSAFLVTPGDGFVARYDKTQLVPFGEYVPLRGLLGRLIGAVASGVARGDVTAGERPRALEVPVEPRNHSGISTAGVVKVGVPICYELLFPDLVRRFVDDGGGILFGITNDAWYGRTGAPYQFLAMTAMRSAETGVYTVRAANTGVSAVIDSGGRVQQRTSIFERGYLVADVPLRSQGKTFYVEHGDVFAATCWVALLGIGFRAYRRGSRPGSRA